MSQKTKVLAYLQENRAMTTMDAREKLDVMHPASRVQVLREDGHDIVTHKRWVDGHEVAEYILLATNFEVET